MCVFVLFLLVFRLFLIGWLVVVICLWGGGGGHYFVYVYVYFAFI